MSDITLKPLLTEGNGEQYIIVNMGAPFKNDAKYYNGGNSFKVIPASQIWVTLDNATRFRKLVRLKKSLEVLKQEYPMVEAMRVPPLTKKRVSQASHVFPLTVIKDGYSGRYSGGLFIAFNTHPHEVPADILGAEKECKDFWFKNEPIDIRAGVGPTMRAAVLDLINNNVISME